MTKARTVQIVVMNRFTMGPAHNKIKGGFDLREKTDNISIRCGVRRFIYSRQLAKITRY